MSLEREIRRRNAIKKEKTAGLRRTCRHCGNRMIGKSGYGWVCQECGWSPKEKEEQ
jgi:ribosomal protein L37AE/L43A